MKAKAFQGRKFMWKKSIFLLFLLPSLIVIGQPNPYTKKFVQVDSYVDSLMKDWNVPGLAIAIVYKDQLIYGRGYGYRDLERKLPFELNTLFPIASNTKLFTSVLAGMLQEEGRLSIDAPIKMYHPSLNFYNDELNAKATLRDLLSHRTGLPRYDGIWVNASYSRNELVSKISIMKPSLRYHEGYIYNNMLFATAGSVMEKVTATNWEDLIKQRFFVPLNMKASCFTQEEMSAYGNFSQSYFEIDSTRQLKAKSFIAISDALGPAGTIKSNIEDLSHWMIALQNKGKFNGKQVIPVAAIEQTLVPNAIADRQGRWNELSNALYGLGRNIQTYKGYKISTHTGSIDGFFSNLTFIPEKELSVFIVFNQVEAGSLRSIVTLPVFDILLGLNYTPWLARYKTDYTAAVQLNKKMLDSIAATQVKNTHPSHPLQAYAGTYKNAAYGDIEIQIQNDQLLFLFRKQKSTLHHFHYDQFVTKEEKTDTPDFRLHFLTNSKGEIDRINTQPYGDPLTEFVRVK
jgi:CubicO group peptidase (beta-lactamase class C family)